MSEEYAEISRRNIARAGLDDRVTVHLGPATDGLAQLPDEPHVDLAYVDADKTGYPAYYDALVPRLRPGGVLVLDNTLLRGRVLDPQDERSTVMAELNERIAADDRVDAVLLGLSDGVTLARNVGLLDLALEDLPGRALRELVREPDLARVLVGGDALLARTRGCSSALASAPCLSTTAAPTSSPIESSGMPITAASETAGCS